MAWCAEERPSLLSRLAITRDLPGPVNHSSDHPEGAPGKTPGKTTGIKSPPKALPEDAFCFLVTLETFFCPPIRRKFEIARAAAGEQPRSMLENEAWADHTRPITKEDEKNDAAASGGRPLPNPL